MEAKKDVSQTLDEFLPNFSTIWSEEVKKKKSGFFSYFFMFYVYVHPLGYDSIIFF